MNLLAFLRPKPSTAGQVLAGMSARTRREAEREHKRKVREICDRMDREMGREPHKWGPL